MSIEKKTMVYIGPTIKHIVKEGNAYRGGYPPRLEEKILNNPVLKDLLVPVSELAQARKELRKTGSRLVSIYNKVKEDVENGRV